MGSSAISRGHLLGGALEVGRLKRGVGNRFLAVDPAQGGLRQPQLVPGVRVREVRLGR